LVGVTHGDDNTTAEKAAEKIWNLRVFEDSGGRINLSAAELGLPLLVVSQFTLYADTSRGRRPSLIAAAPPEVAEPLVDHVVSALRQLGARVETGRFGAKMEVALVNDGPFTVLLDL
jgi:D-tyrosyl-tRNA(Tyr) deacylase